MTFPELPSEPRLYPPPVASGLTPLGAVVTWVKVLIGVAVGLSVLDAVAEAYLISVFDRDSSVLDITPTTDNIYMATGLLGVADLLVFLVAGICVMLLFKRMADNGATIFPQEVEHKSHWAITGWLVPFLNFVRPYQMARQIWNTSRDNDRSSMLQPLPESAKAWWALFLSMNLVARLVPTAPLSATMDELANEAIGLLIVNLVEVGAGILFLVFLNALVERHERALVNPWVQSAPAPPQAPVDQNPPVQWHPPAPGPQQ